MASVPIAARAGWIRRTLVAVAASALLATIALGWQRTADSPATARSFPAQITALSEPGGYFDTDNLISNERSYLQVLPLLGKAGLNGGAYIGVGPDTNYSYIAEVRPAVAFIVDIRRDNLLLHLLFKALFELSETRADYLALLLGRTAPAGPEGGRAAPIDKLVAYMERTRPAADTRAATRRRIEEALRRTGVALSAEDLATIARFHDRFVEDGVALRFQSAGRAPQWHYPTYRDLLLETDASGRQANYLASDESFQFVRSLHARNLIIPVVGDLAGPSAVTAIGRMLAARGERMSVFYTSNVEFYLYRDTTFGRFIANLKELPRTDRSLIVRSVFRYLAPARPGDGSVSQTQSVDDLLTGFERGRFRSYGDLVAR